MILTYNFVFLMLKRAILDCNFFNVLLITIKGTAVIQSERQAAWLETADQLSGQVANVKMFSYIFKKISNCILDTIH